MSPYSALSVNISYELFDEMSEKNLGHCYTWLLYFKDFYFYTHESPLSLRTVEKSLLVFIQGSLNLKLKRNLYSFLDSDC